MPMNHTDWRCALCCRAPTKGLRGVLLAGVLAAAPLAPAAATDEIFLRLQGVQGESTDARHRGEIELLSFTSSWKGTALRGTASATGDARLCVPVTLMKYVDVASPRLFHSMARADDYPKAVITFRRPGQPPIEYYRVTLDDVKVTEIEQSNTRLNFPNPAPPRAIEKVSLRSRRITFEYFAQQADGRLERSAVGWDCGLNRPL